jgi:hypothetical protein
MGITAVLWVQVTLGVGEDAAFATHSLPMLHPN